MKSYTPRNKESILSCPLQVLHLCMLPTINVPAYVPCEYNSGCRSCNSFHINVGTDRKHQWHEVLAYLNIIAKPAAWLYVL